MFQKLNDVLYSAGLVLSFPLSYPLIVGYLLRWRLVSFNFATFMTEMDTFEKDKS